MFFSNLNLTYTGAKLGFPNIDRKRICIKKWFGRQEKLFLSFFNEKVLHIHTSVFLTHLSTSEGNSE